MRRAAAAGLALTGVAAIGMTWQGLERAGLLPAELGDPHLPVGAEVVLAIGEVVAVDADGALLHKPPRTYRVEGAAAWRPGEEWSVGGQWDGEAVVMAWAAPHPSRPAKKALGIVGLVLTTGVLAYGWTVRGTRLVPRG